MNIPKSPPHCTTCATCTIDKATSNAFWTNPQVVAHLAGSYGHEHPTVAVTLYSIGSVNHDQGRYERALDECRESFCEFSGPPLVYDHADVAKSMAQRGQRVRTNDKASMNAP
jgi:hypothetical protein